jgi:hypothetical protein
MKLIEVRSKEEKKEFLHFPLTIYRNDPNWIRPLDNDVESVFDPAVNNLYENGEAVRWLLKDGTGKTIGRVSAFINGNTAHTYKQPTGGMGFFECINNQEAAFFLFDACKKWLAEHGMEAMDGPVNFGEKDRFWGLLVKGFLPPIYCMNYNPPYYKDFFEAYGFKTYFEQYSYTLDAVKPLPERVYKISEFMEKRGGYKFDHLRMKNLMKYAEDFRKVYNKAWKLHDNFKPMTEERAKILLKKIKPVLVEELLWFAYKDGEPIGMFTMLPDINQIFKHVNGKLDLIGKLKFLWYKRGIRKIYTLATGIAPEHQNKGVDAGIVIAAAKTVQPLRKFDELELVWIGDFNPKMNSMCTTIGATLCKTHITYRLLFDPSKPFERAPIVQ